MGFAASTRRLFRSPGRAASCVALAVAAVCVMPTAIVGAEPEPDPAPAVQPAAVPARDGARYPVTRLVLEYGSPHPGHPPIDPVMGDLRVRLVAVADGFIAARSEAEGESLSLAQLNERSPTALYGSAIQLISRRLVSHYSEMGFIGINVGPHPDDIDGAAVDLRPPDRGELRLVIRIGIVTEMRTVAAGDRVPQADRINHPKHQRLVDHSPVKPAAADTAPASDAGLPTDLLRKVEIDRYVAWLNRHPGRRVDVAISPAVQEGAVAMDYLVTENKPWAVYYQLSNTGTDETDEWRHRFGFIDYQFTGRDDILSIDYITAGFDAAHAVLASYEAPLLDADRIRWRVFGSWSEYTASDVGLADEQFEGESYGAGGDLIVNVFQWDELFIDLVAGASWRHERVRNDTLLEPDGETDFLLPHFAIELERYTEKSATRAVLDYAFNAADLAGTDADELPRLGRLDTERSFAVLSWSLEHSFYLEPLIHGPAWDDTATPESSTLAHELAFIFRGQHSFGDRLIPQEQMVLGGGYTVRGYPESVVAGDTAFLFTAEYRFHLPRALPLEPDARKFLGQPFRFAPQHVFGRTDWDLILRAFIDYGHTIVEDAQPGESNEDLLGAGVGIELVYRRNVNIRVDWAAALRDADDRVTAGSNRFHITITLLY